MVDFHIHTKFSDGTDSVDQLIYKIIKSNIKIFSITDHDTIKGCECLHKNFQQKLAGNNIKFVNGIEFSTRFNNSSVHILAYDFDLNNKVLLKLVKEGQHLRKQRTLKRIDLLKSEFNISLPEEEIKEIKRKSNPGRPHIADILVKMGYGKSTNADETYPQVAYRCMTKYLFHELKEYSLPSDYLVSELKKANILTIMAHPLNSKIGKNKIKLTAEQLNAKLKVLTKCGLDGLECYYSEYNINDRKDLLKLAKEYNLLVSAGSDYHGIYKSVALGSLGTDIENVDEKEITVLSAIKSLKI